MCPTQGLKCAAESPLFLWKLSLCSLRKVCFFATQAVGTVYTGLQCAANFQGHRQGHSMQDKIPWQSSDRAEDLCRPGTMIFMQCERGLRRLLTVSIKSQTAVGSFNCAWQSCQLYDSKNCREETKCYSQEGMKTSPQNSALFLATKDIIQENDDTFSAVRWRRLLAKLPAGSGSKCERGVQQGTTLSIHFLGLLLGSKVLIQHGPVLRSWSIYATKWDENPLGPQRHPPRQY